MLGITRKDGQRVVCCGLETVIISVRRDKKSGHIRLGIEAPHGVTILREEIMNEEQKVEAVRRLGKPFDWNDRGQA